MDVHVASSFAALVAVSCHLHGDDRVAPDRELVEHRCRTMTEHCPRVEMLQTRIDQPTMGHVAAGIVLIRIEGPE